MILFDNSFEFNDGNLKDFFYLKNTDEGYIYI